MSYRTLDQPHCASTRFSWQPDANALRLFRWHVCLAVLFSATTATAQIDRVQTESGTFVSGKITAISKDGIQLKTGQATQTFTPTEIRRVLYQGDPRALTEGREFALDGQYEQALQELRTVDLDSLPRDPIKTDAQFYLVLSEAKLALAGKGDKNAAVRATLSFARSNTDSWHYYEIAKLLGDLALELNNYDQAIKYYTALERAPSAELRIEKVYLVGMTKLRQGDVSAALADFDQIAGVDAQSVEVARLKTLAQAGKAVALTRDGKADEGLKVVKELIADLDPTDIEMGARIYNAQGASYLAAGDTEGAILAYLHTHLMFSSVPDAHAEALSQLVKLWPEAGRPERAAEMRQELKQRYPGYES